METGIRTESTLHPPLKAVGGSDAAGILGERELAAALPGFGSFQCVRQGRENAVYVATYSSGQVFSVRVSRARLQGWVEADGSAFLPDVRAAMALRHPNLLAVLHFTRCGEYFIVVTEYVEGRSLGELLRAKQIDVRGAFEIMLQVCEGVGYAHAEGVLHRALSPECVIVEASGRARVEGCGFANVYFPIWDEATKGARMLDYVPVELRLPGMGAAGPRSDIYSIGVMLYLIFTGSLPKGSFFALPSQKAGVEAYLDDAVLRAMHSSSDSRPENIPELIEELTGRRRRSWKGIEGETNDEWSGKKELAENSADGALSWIRNWMVWTVLAVLLAMGGTAAYLVRGKNLFEESAGDSAVLRFLTRISAAGKLLADGERLKGLAAMTNIAAEMPLDLRTLGSLIDALIANGEYDAALDLGQGALDRIPSEIANREALVGRFSDARQRIEDFRKMRRLAALARVEGRARMEHEALLKAQEIMPMDKEVSAELQESPVTVQNEILSALAIVKAMNPGQSEWRYQARIRRGFAELDLSGNGSLADLSGLATAPVRSLDVSNTAVMDLGVLKDLPLRMLVFEGTPVVRVPDEAWFSAIPIVRGAVAGNPVERAGAPEDGKRWVNGLGMRFRSLPGERVMLAERETSVAEFRAFVSGLGAGKGDVLQGFSEGRWQPIKGDWQEPGFESGEDFPVVGVSALEAEAYCAWLTERERRSGVIGNGQRYRLPLDLEWSAAAGIADHPMLGALVRPLQVRSGEDMKVASPWELEILVGLDREEDLIETLPVEAEWIRPRAGASPRGEGFYDLGGNAREWCSDTVDSQGLRMIVRGGGREHRRSGIELRDVLPRMARRNDLGFRVALELKAPVEAARLPNQIAKRDWAAARAEALRLAAGAADAFSRDAGRSFIEFSPLLEAEGRFARLGATEGVGAFEGNHYGLVRIPMPWRDAGRFAESLGGHLASLSTEAEVAFVLRHFLRIDDAPTCWTGAVMRDEFDPWEWSDTADPALLLSRMGESPKKEVASLQESIGVILAAPSAVASGKEFLEARWLSARHSEAHCFLVEWEGSPERKGDGKLAVEP